MPNKKPGVYEANEGIWIRAVEEALNNFKEYNKPVTAEYNPVK